MLCHDVILHTWPCLVGCPRFIAYFTSITLAIGLHLKSELLLSYVTTYAWLPNFGPSHVYVTTEVFVWVIPPKRRLSELGTLWESCGKCISRGTKSYCVLGKGEGGLTRAPMLRWKGQGSCPPNQWTDCIATIGFWGFTRYDDMLVPPFITKIAHCPLIMDHTINHRRVDDELHEWRVGHQLGLDINPKQSTWKEIEGYGWLSTITNEKLWWEYDILSALGWAVGFVLEDITLEILMRWMFSYLISQYLSFPAPKKQRKTLLILAWWDNTCSHTLSILEHEW